MEFMDGPRSDTARMVSMALFRCFLRMVSEFPENVRQRIQLEIVPVQTVLECAPVTNSCQADDAQQEVIAVSLASRAERVGAAAAMKSLALSVFTQTRMLTAHCLLGTQAKSLTGFGPAAVRFDSIQKQVDDPKKLYRTFCTPFILASATGTGEKRNQVRGELTLSGCSGMTSALDDNNVLFVSYCLSDTPQRWLMATATDHRGRILENCLISLVTYVKPDRNFAMHGQVIREALSKLWTFILSVLSMGCHPWRLVIGRIGRLGHSELKEWGRLLSKSNLKHLKTHFCQQCKQCNQMPGYHETPAVLSACLISTEPEANVRVFAKNFTHDERFGQVAKQCPLSTPEDCSCTHILVFPTSAMISVNPGHLPAGMPSEDDKDDNLFAFDITEDVDGLLDILDPNISGGQAAPISAGFLNRPPWGFGSEPADELALQPLALGYYVSTVPARDLPAWFWASCPSAKGRCPVHLKSALHLNISRVQESDDFTLDTSVLNRMSVLQQQQHPLDSKRTSDVLRYVLETYNALSWLTVDMTSGDRISCLPFHVQALLRLYHSATTLISPSSSGGNAT